MKTCADCGTSNSDNSHMCISCESRHFIYKAGPRPIATEVNHNPDEDINEIPNKNLHASENIPTQFNRNKDQLNEGNIEILLKDLIRSQNKTTHAVRAFVRFLFIQLAAITIASGLWLLSNLGVDPYKCIESGKACDGNTALQFLAAAVYIIGVFISSRTGWQELEKSQI